MAVRDNVSPASLRRDARRASSSRARRRTLREMIQRMNIKTPNEPQIVQFLSAEISQKSCSANGLALRPRLLCSMNRPAASTGRKTGNLSADEELARQGIGSFCLSEMGKSSAWPPPLVCTRADRRRTCAR